MAGASGAVAPESVKRITPRGRKPKGKGDAVTLAALLQYGSGMVAYMSRIPGIEYSAEESDMLANASVDALGTLSSKKAKAISLFLTKWSPWLTLGGVAMATTLPKIQLTRAVLAERRLATEARARAIQDTRTGATRPAAPSVSAESAAVGLGVESGSNVFDAGSGSDGRADIPLSAGDGARGLGVES